ncbi:hypothetical protein QTN25_010282 [Entamoeba marina]
MNHKLDIPLLQKILSFTSLKTVHLFMFVNKKCYQSIITIKIVPLFITKQLQNNSYQQMSIERKYQKEMKYFKQNSTLIVYGQYIKSLHKYFNYYSQIHLYQCNPCIFNFYSLNDIVSKNLYS